MSVVTHTQGERRGRERESRGWC